MNIYVDEMPKSCDDCPMCRSGGVKMNRNGRYVDANSCVLGKYLKYRRIDDEVDTCPLRDIKEVQNAKAIEVLGKERERLMALRDLEISAVRENREFQFTSENARLEWVKTKTECAQIYNTEVKIFDQLIAELKGEKYE